MRVWVGRTDAQLEGEAQAKSTEAVGAQEAPGESEKRASGKGGGEFGKVRGARGG